MKKCLYLLIALIALGQMAWAQQEFNVSSEQQLRTNLSSWQYDGCTFNLTNNITLNNGELEVNFPVTINLGNYFINGGDESRIFNVTASGNLTLTGTGYLTQGSNTDGGIIYNAGTVTISGSMEISYGQATNGGAIYNTSTGTLILNGGNISHCEATNGGAIYNAGTLTINEGTIGITDSPNTASNKGGGIFSTGTLTISGGSISGNEAGNGAAINLNGGIFTMTGGTISGNSTIVSGNANQKCGGLNITGNAEATMSGGSIADNTSLDDDGGVYIGSDCTFTMTGGSITGNQAVNFGGIRVDGIFNMSGGSISGNTATNSYGGLRVDGSGTFNMTGGSVSGNTATEHGGIYVNGTLNMTGGSVTGNSATNNYGGIYVNGTLNMSGRPIVMGNLANDNSSNVYLPSNKTITVDDAFTTGANVGITCAGGVNTIFTSGFGTNSPNNQTVFSSDNTAYVVMVYTNEAKLVDYSAPTISDSNVPYLNVLEDGDHGTAYRELCIKMSDKIADNNPTLTQASASEGWYVVDQNLTFNKRITINGTVNLILADNTTLTANKGIFVPYGATLHIWGQSTNESYTGVINATANTTDYSGIGGRRSNSVGESDAGTIVFHGGLIGATGGTNAAGIHGTPVIGVVGQYSIYIFGGTIMALGGDYGAGIGGNFQGVCGCIKITGGSVVGVGGAEAAGIGSGRYGRMHRMGGGGSYSGNPNDNTDITEIRITGGNVTGWGMNGAGIGGGHGKDALGGDAYDGAPAQVYIDGGTVIAYTWDATSIITQGGAVAIGWGQRGMSMQSNYLHIYDNAKITAGTTIHNADMTLQTAANGRNNYKTFKQMLIEPCDHPEHTPITYTDNGSSLSVNCDYCYTKEPYTFQSAGNWNTAANWLGGFMPGAGKDVAVKAAATIPNNYCAHVDTINMLEGGSLTIADGGQLIHSNAGVTATVQKIIAGYTQAQSQGENKANGWYFIASPISTALAPNDVANMLSNTYDLYRFNSTAQKEWENFRNTTEHPDFTLNNGVGYLYANNVQTTLGFTGELKPYSEADGANQVDLGAGWNLVGNPFACNVFASQPFYKMNETNTGMTAELPTTTAIAPCEGIIVKTTEAGNVAFTKDAPQQSAHPGHIQIALAEASNTRGAATALDNAIVSFNEGSQLGKFYFGEQSANIYLPQGGEAYAIAYSDKQGEMPLNFKAKENGTYTLTVNPEGVEVGYLHLIAMRAASVWCLLPQTRPSAGPVRPSPSSATATSSSTAQAPCR